MITKALLLAAAICAAGPVGALELSLSGAAEETVHRSESNVTMHLAIGPWEDGRVKSLTVQGPFVQSAWRLTGTDPDTARLSLDLRSQIEAQGYEVLFSCQTAECGGFDFRYNAGILPAPEMYVNLGDFRYLVARKGAGVLAEHLSLVVSRSATTGHVQLTRIGSDIASSAVNVSENNANTPEPAPMVTLPVSPVQGLTDRLDAGLAVAMDDLVFSTGSSQLAEGEFASITAVIDWLVTRPEARLVLVGHTDDVGSLEANVNVSRLRAEAVRQKLLFEGGIAPERIRAEGVGFLAPRATNQTEAGRQSNRRVEAIPLTAP